MLVYEKKVEDKRHLFGTLGNVPSEDDVQLTYKDNDGDVITNLTTNETYLDDGHGGIIRKSDDKEVNVFIGDDCIIGEVSTPEVKKLAIKTHPTKVEYTVGEELDLTGLTLQVTYVDGDKKIISEGYEATPANGTVLTETDDNVVITYGGKSVNQGITVSPEQTEEQTEEQPK